MNAMTKKRRSKRAPKRFNRLTPILVVSVLLLGGGAITMTWFWRQGPLAEGGVALPALSALADQGKVAFDANCASCHGTNAAGTQKGPPFVHDIYNPGHHSDRAFLLAVRQGVKRHHWPYGDMPPQSNVTDRELAAIVRYVRELQEANGIAYRPHKM